MSSIKFAFGSLAKYNALETKDNDTIYFVDGVIYRGTTPYSNKVSVVSSFPESPVLGIIYVLSTDYSAQYYNGSEWVVVSVGRVTTIDGTSVTNDNLLVTQGAVKAYVTDVIENAEINSGSSSVFKFKGSKESYSQVEALTDNSVGDVWHTSDDGKEYVYTDNDEWELLGFTIDLSSYATTSAVATAKSEAITAAQEYTDEKFDILSNLLTWTDLDEETNEPDPEQGS